MERHPEGLIEGSGVAGAAKAFPFPHKIHVDQGDEYNGETYIWCECVTGEQRPRRLGAGELAGLFEDEGLPALLIFLEHHSR